jgi:hypothetical protein
MTIKQMIACLATVALFLVGGAGLAAAQEAVSTGGKARLTTPDIDALDPAEKQADDDAGPSCHTKGAPECGGSCDITCKENQQPTCIAGTCDPNNTFACTCTVVTSCSCN